MKNIFLVVIGLIFLLTGGFVVARSFDVIRSDHILYQPQTLSGDSQPLPENLPKIPQRVKPRVILTLDVSGSMRCNDPAYLQTQAVDAFYDIYQKLFREIAAENDEALISVVLFGSIAQLIDWSTTAQSDDQQPWLVVDSDNKDLFSKTIKHYLGDPDQGFSTPPKDCRNPVDPRHAQDTDYLAALNEIDFLLSTIPKDNLNQTPPLILFMTDGQYDPFPFFTPALTYEELKKRYDAKIFDSNFKWSRRAKKEFRWLLNKDCINKQNSADDCLLSQDKRGGTEVFGRHKFNIEGKEINISGLPDSNIERPSYSAGYPSYTILDYEDKVKDKVIQINRLLMDTFMKSDTDIPAHWIPVFLSGVDLAGSESDRYQQAVENLLMAKEPEKPKDINRIQRFISLGDVALLQTKFIEPLTEWLLLSKVKIEDNKFVIPPHTRAFAVQLTLQNGVKSLGLTGGGERKLELRGKGRVWAEVFTSQDQGGPEHWQIDIPLGNSLESAAIYYLPRYNWYFHADSRVVHSSDKGTGGQELPIRESQQFALYLYSLSEPGQPISGVEKLGDTLPDEIPLIFKKAEVSGADDYQCRDDSEVITVIGTLSKVEQYSQTTSEDKATSATYAGSIPASVEFRELLSENDYGMICVQVDLTKLEGLNIPLFQSDTRKIMVAPSNFFRIYRAEDGQPGGIDLRRVPATREYWRERWDYYLTRGGE